MKSLLDPGQIIQEAFEDSSKSIRVKTNLAVNISGNQEILITDDVDSIKIGNGAGRYTQVDSNRSLQTTLKDSSNNTIEIKSALTQATGNEEALVVAISPNTPVKTIQIFTKSYDSGTIDYPDSVTEVIKSRVGGIAGTIQETITLVYTDSTKTSLQSWSRT